MLDNKVTSSHSSVFNSSQSHNRININNKTVSNQRFPYIIQQNSKKTSLFQIQSQKISQNNNKSTQKFYKLSIPQRIQSINKKTQKNIDTNLLNNGGLTLQLADSMIQNVIGKLSLPLAVVPMININHKKYIIPMCIQEPSVVAAVSSIGKFLENHTFLTSSTKNIMIGQVHLPNCTEIQVEKILSIKNVIIKLLNDSIPSMVSRSGGVENLKIRKISLQSNNQKYHYVVDIMINVCQAMGANITNMLCQKTKQIIQKMNIHTGIAILSNYCTQRRASASFQIQVQKMSWKGVKGQKVVQKILQAYKFAQLDKYRATTHNKGIMNGVGAVCLATGQDWRAVESAAHSYACRNGQYMPLTHYQIVRKNNVQYFRGALQIPIAVGIKGGVIQKNSIYKSTLQILGNPTAQQLSQIMVVVGLAQNFAALRALAIEGIQKGHMVLHARTIAQKTNIPKQLIDQACKFMATRKKFDIQTAKLFLQLSSKAKL